MQIDGTTLIAAKRFAKSLAEISRGIFDDLRTFKRQADDIIAIDNLRIPAKLSSLAAEYAQGRCIIVDVEPAIYWAVNGRRIDVLRGTKTPGHVKSLRHAENLLRWFAEGVVSAMDRFGSNACDPAVSGAINAALQGECNERLWTAAVAWLHEAPAEVRCAIWCAMADHLTPILDGFRRDEMQQLAQNIDSEHDRVFSHLRAENRVLVVPMERHEPPVFLELEEIAERVGQKKRWARERSRRDVLGLPDVKGKGRSPDKWLADNPRVTVFIERFGPKKGHNCAESSADS